MDSLVTDVPSSRALQPPYFEMRILTQRSSCFEMNIPCKSNKQNKEAQESVFWDVATDLGMTFEENSGNIVKMKNELKQADISTAPQAVMVKEQLDS